MKQSFLSPELLKRVDAFWRAANYLSVAQIYLRSNALLRQPLELSHLKPVVRGYWGTVPGQNFIYVHLNRVIKKYDLNMIYISGPGHGGSALMANAFLEGTYSEIYHGITRDEAGIEKICNQFSFPGGIPYHLSPKYPGTIQEGSEQGYSLSHAFGAVFDNPSLIAACVIGDGEAETGPLATSWHSNKFLNPITDGAVLPILHLNGYKTTSPSVLARIPHKELEQFLRGCGWSTYYVEGDEPEAMHQRMAEAMEKVVVRIRNIQDRARNKNDPTRPSWPMIVLKSPKGWTGPKVVDGHKNEGNFRAHPAPFMIESAKPSHFRQLERWLQSYKPSELFDDSGRLISQLSELAPQGERRMGANPHANGGLLLQDLVMPDYRNYALNVSRPGTVCANNIHILGLFLRDVVKLNQDQRNFRMFSPDEMLVNGLEAVFESTNRQWCARMEAKDEFLATDGRVIEILSEHQCEGWLEGYLLTGRHGILNCCDAFADLIVSMLNQHAKWLKISGETPWRRKIAALNYLIASNIWHPENNGLQHQGPRFIDHAINKNSSYISLYMPPDANCLLSVWDHCLRSRHCINVVIAGNYKVPQWLAVDDAVEHCRQGIEVWQWAGCDGSEEPDVVMVCCGDEPTLETLAAVSIINKHLPDLRVRVINVINLMKLLPQNEHPSGLSDREFDKLFPMDKPIIFAFYGYPGLIHQLTYRRTNHKNLHVHGYKEEGIITTPFDMAVLNDLDRFHLVIDVIHCLPRLGTVGARIKQLMADKLKQHKQYIVQFGQDMPEIQTWEYIKMRVESDKSRK